jgi:hypothetical protein
MPKLKRRPGDVNVNGQQLIRRTRQPGNHPNQRIWVLRCSGDENRQRGCGAEYGANGCDFHIRRCPKCQHGASGLDCPEI